MIDGEVGSGVGRVLMFSTFKGLVGEECIFVVEPCGVICMRKSELLMPLCGITSFGRIESPMSISVEATLKNVNFSRRTENFYRFSHHRQTLALNQLESNIRSRKP